MTDNIVNFPKKETIDADHVLTEAVGKLDDCIVLGTTKDGEAYYSICAQGPEQVIYLMRVLEHLLIEHELN